MTTDKKIYLSAASFIALFVGAILLTHRGVYGWTLFVMLPVIAGIVGATSFRPTTALHAAGIGASIGAIGCALLLLLGQEGFICVLMALPVIVPLTTLGSLLAWWSNASSRGNRPSAMCLLLPVSLFYDVNAKPPLYSVTTSIVVNAPPELVWRNVVAFPDITDRPDWVLGPGLAYPIRTRIEGSGPGALRSCDLSTGTVEERVLVWDAPRLLRFVVTATPPAMKEMGLYGPIYPKHLNGYYVSKQGQFELSKLPDGRTLVIGTSWYEHGLWPAEYWRWWSDTVVHHIHTRVLEHIRVLSESRKSG